MSIFRKYKIECQNRDKGVRLIALEINGQAVYRIQARMQGWFFGIKYWHTYCQTNSYPYATDCYDFIVTLRTPLKER